MAIITFSPGDTIPTDVVEMTKEAQRASSSAYVPYSNYRVGAVVRDASGKLFRGSNQENASYPLCMCAERVALYHMSGAVSEAIIESLAVFAFSSEYHPDIPPSPCGACRQVISEYQLRQNDPFKVILSNQSGYIWIVDSIDDLLPWAFDPRNLKL